MSRNYVCSVLNLHLCSFRRHSSLNKSFLSFNVFFMIKPQLETVSRLFSLSLKGNVNRVQFIKTISLLGVCITDPAMTWAMSNQQQINLPYLRALKPSRCFQSKIHQKVLPTSATEQCQHFSMELNMFWLISLHNTLIYDLWPRESRFLWASCWVRFAFAATQTCR